jgi:hypothetical protein
MARSKTSPGRHSQRRLHLDVGNRVGCVAVDGRRRARTSPDESECDAAREGDRRDVAARTAVWLPLGDGGSAFRASLHNCAINRTMNSRHMLIVASLAGRAAAEGSVQDPRKTLAGSPHRARVSRGDAARSVRIPAFPYDVERHVVATLHCATCAPARCMLTEKAGGLRCGINRNRIDENRTLLS